MNCGPTELKGLLRDQGTVLWPSACGLDSALVRLIYLLLEVNDQIFSDRNRFFILFWS